MNNDRRKELTKAFGLIEEAKSILEDVAGEERDAYDNMPESMQSSERGEKISENADQLDEAVSSLESAISNIETAQE